MSLSFPPFTRAVKWLVLANAGVFLLMALLGVTAPSAAQYISPLFGLVPRAVVHGFIWQLVTYSFLHAGLFHLLFNMLSVWMFGGMIESTWGTRRFVEFYLYCVLAAAATTIAVAYIGVAMLGAFADVPLVRGLAMQTMVPTVGASGGVYGILMAFGMLYGEQEVFLFPLPFRIKAKYMVAILIFLVIAGAVQETGGVANLAHLGGLFFGFLYVKYAPTRSFTGRRRAAPGLSLRDRYYRWKRRRAARKFQVYMKKQGRDVSGYFDQYGNYREPGSDERERKDNWVN